jgi:XTP/dITP diphosphohydrolase
MHTGSPTLVLATRNPGKVREIRDLLSGLPLAVTHLGELADPPDLAEPHDAFADNAREKALAVARATGHLALADDSGLMVDALGGAPGVRSSRFAGEAATDADRVARLLREMEGVPDLRRTARFVCALVLAGPQGQVGCWEGRAEGRILTRPRGSGGFGYDPVFYYPPARMTFAEMTPDRKNRVSHRARALQRFRRDLPHILERLSAAADSTSREGSAS